MRIRGALVAVVLAIAPAWGADTHVHIQGFAFSPNAVTVSPGSTVSWDNHDGVNHTVTSDSGSFNSGVIPPGGTFTLSFPSEGQFPYHCAIHLSMTGTITVGTPPPQPSEPRSLVATPGQAVGSIRLTWSPPAYTGTSPITSYVVCRTTQGPAECFSVGLVLSYTDTGRPLLVSHTYTVQAVNASGAGPPSAPACTRPFPWHPLLGC